MKTLNRRLLMAALVVLLLLAAVPLVAAQTEPPAETTWLARYWNNMDLEGDPVVTREETGVSHDWGLDSPAPEVTPDTFSASWTSFVQFEEGTYRFTTVSDDGVRLWVDNRWIINDWESQVADTNQATISLPAGEHPVVLEYFENKGLAEVQLDWERVGPAQDQNETITIRPTAGPVGTQIFVTAAGFPANTDVTFALGPAGEEAYVSRTETTNEQGVLDTVVTLPPPAELGEQVRVFVNAPGDEMVLSDPFLVTTEDAGQGGTAVCGPTYVVQPDDWLSRIANRCNTTVEALLAVNPQITNPDLIYPGQVLDIPPAQDLPQVDIAPDAGLPGTELSVEATGLPAFATTTVGIGPQGSEPTDTVSAVTDAAGELNTTIMVPVGIANPGEQWVVLVSTDGFSALSEPFTVRAEPTAVTATMQAEVGVGLHPLPRLDTEVLEIIPLGTQVPVIARSDDNRWLLVRYQGRQGWISAAPVSIDGDLTTLPVETP